MIEIAIPDTYVPGTEYLPLCPATIRSRSSYEYIGSTRTDWTSVPVSSRKNEQSEFRIFGAFAMSRRSKATIFLNDKILVL